MSQHNSPFPFLFRANGAQPAPSLTAHPQSNVTSANMQPQSQGTSVQQEAVQQNAQLPGVDMSVLQNISPQQLAAIAHLFHSGALNMPPPAAPSDYLPPLQTNQPAAQVPNAGTITNQDIDMDREDGELRENEVVPPPITRDFLRPPPTGPRSRSISPRRPGVTQQQQNGASRLQKQVQKPNEKKQSASQQNQVSTDGQENSHRSAMKMFVQEMVKSGATYDQMVADVGNSIPLARMFKELGLSVSSERNLEQLSRVNSTPNSTSASILPSRSEPKVVPAPKRPTPAKPAALNRNEYLAKLQAAKNKKADDTSTKSTTSNAADATADATAIATADTLASRTVDESSQARSAVESSSESVVPKAFVDKTALIRERLEALKAKKAATDSKSARIASSPVQKRPSPPPVSRQAASSPPRNGLGAGLTDIPSRVAQASLSIQPANGTSTPISSTSSRTFSGLPGLFMTDASSHQPAPSTLSNNFTAQSSNNIPVTSRTPGIISAPSPGPLALPRKRPVASDFDDVATRSGSVKRPFGQSRNASEDESLIIEVSDDDEEGEGGEAGEMQFEGVVGVGNPASFQTKPFRDAGPLRNFPPRSVFNSTGSSTGTPGVTTPGGVSFEQMTKDIEDMKRQIAEREQRKAANGKAVLATPVEPVNVSTSGAAGTPVLDTLTEPMSRPDIQSITTPARQEKERMEQRLIELEHEQQRVKSSTNISAAATAPDVDLRNDLPSSSSSADLVQLSQGLAEQSTGRIDVASEDDGESSESISNFYEAPDAPAVEEEHTAPLNGSKIGSQTMTASENSFPETNDISEETTPSQATQAHDDGTAHAQAAEGSVAEDSTADEDGDNDNDDTMLSPIGTDSQTHVTGTAEDDDSMESGQINSEDEDMQDREPREDVSVEETDDDDDQDDLSDIGKDADSHPQESIIDHDAEEGEILDDVDSAASEELKDYEPELYELDTSNLARETGKDGTLATISSVNEPEVAGQDHLPDDDLAPELQPNEQQLDTPIQDEYQKPYYAPYESPLKMFRSYKYHPAYLDTVPDGYRSLTYNNNIDPVRPLCRYETDGGVCNDNTCQSQHFKTMALPDATLLNAMATEQRPTLEPEKTRWNQNLATLIKELKSNKINDAAVIAAKIADFKRDFDGDATKVLRLE